MNGTTSLVNKLFILPSTSGLSLKKSRLKYLRLLEDCGNNLSGIQGTIMAMRNVPNLEGFSDGNWYKIRSVKDNTVIQIDPTGNKLICAEESDEHDELQRFQAVQQSSGKFQIVSKFQKPGIVQVWDYLAHRDLLIQRKQSRNEKFTQNWMSEHVPGFDSLYLIQSGPSEDSIKCLKNSGVGIQIKLVSKTPEMIGDLSLQWNLELQDFPS